MVFSLIPAAQAKELNSEIESSDSNCIALSPGENGGPESAILDQDVGYYESVGDSEEFAEFQVTNSALEAQAGSIKNFDSPESLDLVNTSESKDCAADHISDEEESGSSVSMRQISFTGNEITVGTLATLIGIKSYKVARHLLAMEILASPSDPISMEIAKVVAKAYGIEILSNNSTESIEEIDADNESKGVFLSDKNAFEIKTGITVVTGDWIRDSELGLGRILRLCTHPTIHDRHRVWFVGNTVA